MQKASPHIALALLLLFLVGKGIKIDNRSYLNDFWNGVIFGFLVALYIFNFYLGYIEKDIKKDIKKD